MKKVNCFSNQIISRKIDIAILKLSNHVNYIRKQDLQYKRRNVSTKSKT